MKIKIHKLNRDRKKVGIVELDLTKFQKIATTGHGLALKYKMGETLELFGEYVFDDWYVQEQKRNDEDSYVKLKVASWKFISDTECEKYREFVKQNPNVDYEHYYDGEFTNS